MQASETPDPLIWQWSAACADADPTLFFPGPHDSAVPALRLCATCVVKQRCLQAGMAMDAGYGIWGGMTASGRRRLGQVGA